MYMELKMKLSKEQKILKEALEIIQNCLKNSHYGLEIKDDRFILYRGIWNFIKFEFDKEGKLSFASWQCE